LYKDLSLEENYCEGSDGVQKRSHSLITFTCSMPWNFLTKFGKDYASCLSACASLWIAIGRQNDFVQHDGTSDYNGCNWCGRE